MTSNVIARKTYSVPQAAAILGIGKGTAYELAREGRLPGVLHIGNRMLVSRKVLDAYVNGESEPQADAS